ncbi:spindle and kinetochore-associated protein 2 isoform 1-T1 [Podargus strigoides]
METALNRFETLFQKAESDLDYIQHRLEFEIMKSLPDNPAPELDKIFMEQRESMECIRSGLKNVMGMVQTIQQCADLERLPLSEEEWAAVQLLTCQTVKGMESPVEKELEPSVFSSTEEQH